MQFFWNEDWAVENGFEADISAWNTLSASRAFDGDAFAPSSLDTGLINSTAPSAPFAPIADMSLIPQIDVSASAAKTLFNTIPGDTSTTATLTIGEQIIETLEVANDEDWFRIELEAGVTYAISHIGVGENGTSLVDPLVRVLDENGIELAQNDDIILGEVRYSLLNYTAPESGTYYISAEAWTVQTGNYALTVTENLDVAADLAASTATLGQALVNGTVAGTISNSNDEDWFAVNLEAGQRYLISQYGEGGSQLTDPLLDVRDSAGNVLQSDNNTGPDLDARLSFTADASGLFYLSAGASFGTGDYALTVQEVPTLVERDLDGIANFLTDEFDDRESYASTTITYNVSGLSSGAQDLARRALDAWADIAPFNFVESNSSAQIRFTNDGDGASNSNTVTAGGTVTASVINIASDWNGGILDVDSYTYQTFLHEIGHSIGLGHAGHYNGSATYGVDNAYLNDSWALTIMSYFDQRESGYFGDFRLALGPQIADILAIQELYGLNTTTRNTDTVYGFNSTLPLSDIHNFENPDLNNVPSLSIYDRGGVDTIDVSGYTVSQRIDLREESFSDINGLDSVISIARDTLIENAITGTADDILIGNATINDLSGGDGDDVLTGNGGNDILDGGAGTDYAVLTGADISEYAITVDGDGYRVEHIGNGSDGIDTLKDIEFLRLGGEDLLLSDLVGTFSESDDVFEGSNAGETIDALGGNDTVNGMGGNDIIDGGAGDDTINGGTGNDLLTGGTGADTFVLMDGAGLDEITDFEDGIDTIMIGDGPLYYSQLSIYQAGDDVVIKSLHGETTLTGMLLADLDQSDFIFVPQDGVDPGYSKKPAAPIFDPDVSDNFPDFAADIAPSFDAGFSSSDAAYAWLADLAQNADIGYDGGYDFEDFAPDAFDFL